MSQTPQTTTTFNSPEFKDRNAWVWGFTPQAEIWNGRFAQVGFVTAVLIELFFGKGFLHFWGIL